MCAHSCISMSTAAYPRSGCNEFDVRLTYRDRSQASGNLEICVHNTWTMVCYELFDENSLNVTCRALGFPYFNGSMKTHQFFEDFTNGSGPKFHQQLFCYGSESSLSECYMPYVADNSCTNVRIQCLGKDLCCKLTIITTYSLIRMYCML